MQFVSEGSGAKTTYAAREESSNPEPPRSEDGKTLYDRLKDNKEKKLQLDSERVTAGGPSAISEEEYMFFIELERKQKHISKQVDRETEAFQKQVQSLTYQPDTSLLALVAHKPKSSAKKDAKKPKLSVVPKAALTGPSDALHEDEAAQPPAKRKDRAEDEAAQPPAKRKDRAEDEAAQPPAKRSKSAPAEPAAEAASTESGLGALLGYGSEDDA